MKIHEAVPILLVALIVAVAGIGYLTATQGGSEPLSRDDAELYAASLGIDDYDRISLDIVQYEQEFRSVWVFEKYYGDMISIYMQDWVTVLVLDVETGQELPFVQPQ